MNLTPVKSFVTDLPDFSKIIFSFAPITYLIGFLVVNSYLAQFNAFSIDVLRVRYFMAGIVFIISSSLLFYIFHFAKNKLAYEMKRYESIKGADLYDLVPNITFTLWLIVSFIFVCSVCISSIFSSLQTSASDDIFKGVVYLYQHDPYLGGFLSKIYGSKDSVDIALLWLGHIIAALVFVALIIFKNFFSKRFFRPKTEKTDKPTSVGNYGFLKSRGKTRKLLVFILIAITAASLIVHTLSTWRSLYNHVVSVDNIDSLSLNSSVVYSWLIYATLSILLCIVNLELWKVKSWQDFQNVVYNRIHMLFLVGLVSFLSIIFFFGTVIYPRVPTQLGGGQPRKVMFELKDTKIDDSSTKYYLIDVTSSSYIAVSITKSKKEAIEISKSNVNKVTYIEK